VNKIAKANLLACSL